MSKLKMNCGYCGRKCDLDKDFCIPQDSVYVCKSCYEWQNRVADLEAKLAESEEFTQGYRKECAKIQSENVKLKQQLAEKDKLLREKIGSLKTTDFIRLCLDCGFMVDAKDKDNQDKIEFAIAELEKVEETMFKDSGRDVYDIILCQINQLKEMK